MAHSCSCCCNTLRKGDAISLVCPMADENQWLVFVVLLHQRRVLKAFQHTHLSLNASICNVTNLVAVKYFPVLAKILPMKRDNISIVHKIDKSVASIAPVLKVDWKVKEINLARSMSIHSKFGQ